MIETSSLLPWKSLVIFGNLWKYPGVFGNNYLAFGQLLEHLRKFFGKCLEIFRKSSKKLSLVCIYNKQNNTWLLDISQVSDLLHCVSSQLLCCDCYFGFSLMHKKANNMLWRWCVIAFYRIALCLTYYRPYSYFWIWTGTCLQWRFMWCNII